MYTEAPASHAALLTFRGVDRDAGRVQLLLRLPVLVPPPRPGREQDNHQQHGRRYTPSLAFRSTPYAQQMGTLSYEQAKSHARDVQDPLRNDEAHVEEQIGSGDEWKHNHGQRHDEHV